MLARYLTYKYMSQNYNNQNLNFSASDSTLYVSYGSALVGQYILDFRGGNIPFASMTNFDLTTSTTNGYVQNSVLSLINFNNFADLSSVYTAPVATEASLQSLYTADTSTSRPIGSFLFQFDGTSINLKSSSKVL